MLRKVLSSALNLYDEIDAIIIVNKDGIVEYSAVYDPMIQHYKNDNTSGMHILEVYPSLKKEDSSIMRVLKTGKPILYEKQIISDRKGNLYNFINSTVPIIENNNVIGVIEVSKFFSHEEASHQDDKKDYYTLDDIITKDVKMLEIKEKITRIAQTDSTVLISGETGTGKELVAQSIHYHSNRKSLPFIALNCASIPENLMESALFGTTKGAYTGAENKAGLISEANGGTLFLDEIHTMPLNLQSKLLRFLEDKRVRRLGENEDNFVDVRIIAAMNVKSTEVIDNKLIREDLYYRLSVVQINIPPLRARKSDIQMLVDYFIGYYNGKMNKSVKGVSELVMNIFTESNWRGNVRELKYVIEGAFNLIQGEVITLKELPEQMLNIKPAFVLHEESIDQQDMDLSKRVEIFEKGIISETLKGSRSLSETSKKLGISRQSLRYKLEKFNLYNYFGK